MIIQGQILHHTERSRNPFWVEEKKTPREGEQGSLSASVSSCLRVKICVSGSEPRFMWGFKTKGAVLLFQTLEVGRFPKGLLST